MFQREFKNVYQNVCLADILTFGDEPQMEATRGGVVRDAGSTMVECGPLGHDQSDVVNCNLSSVHSLGRERNSNSLADHLYTAHGTQVNQSDLQLGATVEVPVMNVSNSRLEQTRDIDHTRNRLGSVGSSFPTVADERQNLTRTMIAVPSPGPSTLNQQLSNSLPILGSGGSPILGRKRKPFVFEKEEPKYMLKEGVDFRVWKEKFEVELTTKNLIDVIHPDTEYYASPQEERIARERVVRNILLEHCAPKYYNLIFSKDPREGLKAISALQKTLYNETPAKVRKLLEEMKYDGNKQSLLDFNLKFDDLAYRYSVVKGKPLDDEVLVDYYYTAVRHAASGLPHIRYIQRVMTQREDITLDEMKKLVAEHEFDERFQPVESAKVMFMKKEQQEGKQKVNEVRRGRCMSTRKCYNFGKPGHYARSCFSKHETNVQSQLFKSKTCYNCNRTGHVAVECRSLRGQVRGRARFGCRVRGIRHSGKYNCGVSSQSSRGRECPVTRSRTNLYQGKTARANRGTRGTGGRGASSNNNQQTLDSNGNNKKQETIVNYVAQDEVDGVFYHNTDMDFENLHEENPLDLGAVESAEMEYPVDSSVCFTATNDADGKTNNFDSDGTHFLTLLADSGASDHVIKDLGALTECTPTVEDIRSANVEDDGTLKISQQGTIKTYTANPNRQPLSLLNVKYSNQVAENLCSLRKFAEEGYYLYQDDQVIEIKDKKTQQILLAGVYKKPLWMLNLELQSDTSKPSNENQPSGSQDPRQIVINFGASDSNEKSEEAESFQEISQKDLANQHRVFTKTLAKEVSLESIPDVDLLEEINTFDSPSKTVESVGMLWHRRLGHISIQYLEAMKKVLPEISKIRFSTDIVECSSVEGGSQTLCSSVNR